MSTANDISESQNTFDFPIEIKDLNRKSTFTLLKLLGKGSFGKCYLVEQKGRNKRYACKIVPKYKFKNKTRWRMIKGEVIIHSSLRHKHIVTFHRVFEDSCLMYTLQELCMNGTLWHVQKKRKYITATEARYYVRQILAGVEYLHKRRVVHGDLKLSNIFIDKEMKVKIGDFGLADFVEKNGSIRAICGTPNYMAPEIIEKRGHNFNADIWAIGCILYYLLVGKPPFQGVSETTVFNRIRSCDVLVYQPGVRRLATDCFKRIFQIDQFKRPSASQLLNFDFFRKGFTPHTLPRSCLSDPPGPRLFKSFSLHRGVCRRRRFKAFRGYVGRNDSCK